MRRLILGPVFRKILLMLSSFACYRLGLKILSMLCFFSAMAGLAQAPYAGGVGDGYARATWQLQTSEVEASVTVPGWAIMPQPAASGQQVRWRQPRAEAAEVQLHDLSGAVLARWSLPAAEEGKLRLPEVSPGLYFLRLQTPTQTFQQPILIHP